MLSVNRPRPEDGVLIGGPSVAFDPNGELLEETTNTLALVTLDARVATGGRRADVDHATGRPPTSPVAGR